jgi:isoquinoline 1-oxidoreductase beta subunit
MGIAVSSAEERQSPTWVAGIAEVTVDPKTGIFKINHIWIAMDPGTVVNPLNATAQIQGAALWGASQILSERLTYKNGAIEQTNFDTYNVMRIDEMPKVETVIVPTGDFWGGVGEPTISVAAPAVLNAIFAATGKRIRNMPLMNNDLRAA